ncbi:hypothetical protein RCOM_0447050 [Ricinus communis]|uniref:Pentatricopeptide repeat-containing protein n=1 Tax=Ricinus communis TaxID=3988 RepID=B9T3S2_RICCO|nr:hypothetical protein RCOM_0447050 [Ricinus communis]
MRHSWRLLLFRNYPRSSLRTHQHHFQVHSSSLSHIRSLYSLHTFSQQSHLLEFKNNKRINLNKGPTAYNFSSDALIESENKKEPDPQCLLISDIFTKFSDVNDITKDLELNNVVVDHELVLKVLNFLECNPDVARKFFDWVLEKDSERLSSKAYNLMLKVLGFNGFVEEFWDLVEIMKKKGYGVSRGTRDKVAEKFEKDGLKSDLEKLKEVFASGSVDHSLEKIALRMSRIVRNQVWGEDVEKQIKDLNAVFSSDMDGFTDALKLLDLMKDHGNPPFLTPFIKHVSKRGTGDDAIVFMRAMTTKKFPSTSVVLRLFEAFFKAGRHSEAQIFLSKCPHYIRNHADVLNLFYSMKAGKDTAAAAAVADKDTAAAAAV